MEWRQILPVASACAFAILAASCAQPPLPPAKPADSAAKPPAQPAKPTDSGKPAETAETAESAKEPVAKKPSADLKSVKATYYVSAESGSDSNPGKSADKPFKSISKAAAAAGPGETVAVGPGVYRETVAPRSGKAGKPVTFLGVGRPVVSGAEEVTGWEPHKEKIYKAKLPGDFFKNTHNNALQIFCDGKMLNLARWPNMGLDPNRPAKAVCDKFVKKSSKDEHKAAGNWSTSTVEDKDLAAVPDALFDGAKIFVQPNFGAWSWAFSGEVVSKKGAELTFKSRNASGKDFKQDVLDDKTRYHIFDTLALLDADGEWFHDAKAGVLYVRLPGGDDPAKHRVEAKKREFAFDLSQKSFVTVKGFDVFGATLTTDADAGGDNVGYEEDGSTKYPWRGRDYSNPSEGVVVENCRFQYPSHFTDVSGHFFLQWGMSSGVVLSGKNHAMRRCEVRDSAGNGVSCPGTGHKIVGNTFAGIAYAGTDQAAINTCAPGGSTDIEIAYNTIKECGRSGITPRGLKNSATSGPGAFKARIHHNDISGFGMQDWDTGAIYMAEGRGNFLRIDHNLIHDACPDVDGVKGVGCFTASGVYPDYCADYIIDHNAIWNVEWGIHLQNVQSGKPGTPANYIVHNNTVLVKAYGDPPSSYGPFGIVTNSGAKQEGTILFNNILAPQGDYKGYKPIDSFVAAQKLNNIIWDGKAGSEKDPHFVDMEKFDLALKPGSPAIGAGRRIESLDRGGSNIPLRYDKREGAPDAGAFQSGEEPWKAGADALPKNY